MNNKWTKVAALLLSLGFITTAQAWDKGIYLTQYMLEKPDKLDYLIRESKATGINTFVIDHEYYGPHYAPAMAKVKAAGFKIVTRIVVFDDGGNAQQVKSQEHWEKRFKLAEDAINSGADAIQLDYIRYSSKEPANPQHAKDIYVIIKWFKEKINAHKIPMEIDIFGEVSYHPSLHVGQDLKMFADSVDGMNPMVYPSHFWPYQKYSAEPYKTINDSLNALIGHFDGNIPFKVHAFIEAANFHYVKKTSNAEKQKYLLQEIRAVEDAKGVSGWYVWSANNVYENLFQVLRNNKIKDGIADKAFFNDGKYKYDPEADKKLADDSKNKNAQDKIKQADKTADDKSSANKMAGNQKNKDVKDTKFTSGKAKPDNKLTESKDKTDNNLTQNNSQPDNKLTDSSKHQSFWREVIPFARFF